MKLNKWLTLLVQGYQSIRNIIIICIMFRLLFLDTEKLEILKPLLDTILGTVL